MERERPGVDGLQPEARFAVRAAASGLTWDDVGSVLRLDGPTVRKHLWTAVRMTGGIPPVRAAGDDVLAAALTPVLAMAAQPPGRTPSTACPSPDVARALALGELDGPLLLAEAEHMADCPACLVRLVADRRAPAAAPAPAVPARRGLDAPLVLGALAGAAIVVAYLLLR